MVMITRTAIGSLLFYLGIVVLTVFPLGIMWLFLLTLTEPNGYVNLGSPLNLVLSVAITVIPGLFLIRGGIKLNPELTVQKRRTMRRAVILVVITFLLSIVV